MKKVMIIILLQTTKIVIHENKFRNIVHIVYAKDKITRFNWHNKKMFEVS